MPSRHEKYASMITLPNIKCTDELNRYNNE